MKVRYSAHYEITREALEWLVQRTELLVEAVENASLAHLDALKRSFSAEAG